MTPEQVTCPLCQGVADRSENWMKRDVYRYTGCACGTYGILRDDEEDFLANQGKRDRCRARDIGILLRERRAKRGERPIPFLHFIPDIPQELPNTFPIRVSDLLAQWPSGVPEKIERCFCYLINAVSDGMSAGQVVEIFHNREDEVLIFTEGRSEHRFFIDAMVDFGWVDPEGSDQGAWNLVVTPTGWAQFDALTRTSGDARNPVFVAMPFGSDETEKKKMTKIYENAIEPAIRAAGYLWIRADSEEHNEAIMDRIVADIRKAPFVVAEIGDNNPNVAYEAGFARGLCTEVIYCSRAGSKLCFDVSGINHVRWNDEDHFREKLEDRIRGTVGENPYKLGEPAA